MGLAPSKGKFQVSTPSNIAFVKYWGKYGNQLPMNPSISMTLDHCRSEFVVEYDSTNSDASVELIFNEQRNEAFEEKLNKLKSKLSEEIPELKTTSLKISSSNTFPHSAGIASSASAMSAFAYTVAFIVGREKEQNFVSHLARLCSGSASRSLFSYYAIWGKNELFERSTQDYAVEFDRFHSSFTDLRDSIVIVDAGEKSVSSTAGHALMDNNPYREGRIKQANKNFNAIVKAMQVGDFKKFGEILENEALSLHGLMLSSSPSYILLKPMSLQLIESLKSFRAKTGLPVYFTIDAGPNIHVIYPGNISSEVKEFLYGFCQGRKLEMIHDKIGGGPRFELLS